MIKFEIIVYIERHLFQNMMEPNRADSDPDSDSLRQQGIAKPRRGIYADR